jgi:streptomycin 6-kinase
MHSTPQALSQRMLELHGKRGSVWLAELPELIARLAKQWRVQLGPPFDGLSYSYAAPGVRRDGMQIVLKCTVPNRELNTEIEALRLFGGHGAVRLLEADAELGAVLLERIVPGMPLVTLADDEQATHIAIEVMRRLWQPAPAEHTVPTVADWGKGFRRLRTCFDGGTGCFPQNLVRRAEKEYAELTSSMDARVLLHGDLHHWNMLYSADRGWLAIDPKGVVGEPAYETGALLRNPYPDLLSWPDLARTTRRRLDQLAEGLGFDRERLAGWAFAQAVLSAWWSYEDRGHDWQQSLELADSLAEL